MTRLWIVSVACSGFQHLLTFTWPHGTYLGFRMWLPIVPPVLVLLVIWNPYVNILIIPLSHCICPQKHSIFCLTDSPTGATLSASKIVGISRNLPNSLDKEVLLYCANSFAASTSRTYSTQRSTFLRFCADMKISPVPLSQENLGRYIAFLSTRLFQLSEAVLKNEVDIPLVLFAMCTCDLPM